MALGVGIAGLVLAVGTTVSNTRDKNRAIADQREIDDLNASNLAAESKESEKRLETSNKRTEGLLRAHVAGAGFAVGGSTSNLTNTIIEEGRSDLDWMRTAGKSRLNILKNESRARLRLNKAERTTGVSSGINNAIGAGIGTYTSAGGTF